MTRRRDEWIGFEIIHFNDLAFFSLHEMHFFQDAFLGILLKALFIKIKSHYFFCFNQKCSIQGVCPPYMLNPSHFYRHDVNQSTSDLGYPFLERSIPFFHQRLCFASNEFYSPKLKSRLQETNRLILIKRFQILISLYTLSKFPLNIFTGNVIIYYYFLASIYFDAYSH